MKIQVLSDIHLEFRNKKKDVPLIRNDADYIVFAGDIATSPRDVGAYFKHIRELTSAKFIYVLGNHEFYGKVHPNVIDEYINLSDEIESLYVLEKSSASFKEDNIRFVGATGWTSYRDGQDQEASEGYMNDFRAIKVVTDEGKLKPVDTRYIRREHTASKLFFEANARKEENERVIMVVHHGVSPKSISTKYVGSRINGAFYEDLRELLHDTKPFICIHGHTHHASNYYVGETLVVCNPMGYLFEYNNGFVDGLTLKVDKGKIEMD